MKRDKKTIALMIASIVVGIGALVATVIYCVMLVNDRFDSDSVASEDSLAQSTVVEENPDRPNSSADPTSGDDWEALFKEWMEGFDDFGPDGFDWGDFDWGDFDWGSDSPNPTTPSEGMDWPYEPDFPETISLNEDAVFVYTDPEQPMENLNDYLEEFGSCLDESVSYGLDWDFDHRTVSNGNVSWTVDFYQLSGEIPNLEEINRRLYAMGTYGRDFYLTAYDVNDYFNGQYSAKSNTYITYNDETFLSAITVTSIEVLPTVGVNMGLYFVSSFNVDLTTGKIYENSELFCPNDSFVERMKAQSLLQNGEDALLADVDDFWYLSYLASDEYNIVFFSPKGLEVGFNYDATGDNVSFVGYLTITLNEITVEDLPRGVE